jgi:hypothetical protein
VAEVTFRDFAGAAMSGRSDEAARVLGQLLALDDAAAVAATAHFTDQMKTGGQPFMMKAMGLRQAVTSQDSAAIGDLVAACFGIEGAALDGAVTALRARYG